MRRRVPSSGKSSLPPTFRVYERTSPPEDARVVDVDGQTRTPNAVRAVFDHHRTGERVNLDTVKLSEPGLEGHELATHKLDPDYLVSAVTLWFGGKEHVPARFLRILYATSELGDHLEQDAAFGYTDVAAEGKQLLLYLLSRQKQLMGEQRALTVEGEGEERDRALADRKQSLVATLLARDLIQAVRNDLRGSVAPGTKSLDDLASDAATAEMVAQQERWHEGVRVNDELLAVVEAERDLESLYVLELVRGDMQVLVMPKRRPDGVLIGNKIRVSLKPAAYGKYDLSKLLPLLNDADPNVVSQVVPAGKTPQRWGGRDVVISAAYDVWSGFSAAEIEAFIREHIAVARTAPAEREAANKSVGRSTSTR